MHAKESNNDHDLYDAFGTRGCRPRRGAARRSGTDPAFLIAAALFLAVVIAEAVFIALAAPSIPDIGALYITVT
jgi:hypothetical protein